MKTMKIFAILACMMLPSMMTAASLKEGMIQGNQESPNTISLFFAGNIQKNTSTFSFALEKSTMINKSFFFLSYGAELSISSSKFKTAHYKTESKATFIQIPVLLGGYFGNRDGLHATVRAGVSTNLNIRTKIDGEVQKMSFKDRFGWNGVVRGTIGFKIVSIMVEYDFPFKSGVDGMLMLGVCCGI